LRSVGCEVALGGVNSIAGPVSVKTKARGLPPLATSMPLACGVTFDPDVLPLQASWRVNSPLGFSGGGGSMRKP
jgi:hypothetical protein